MRRNPATGFLAGIGPLAPRRAVLDPMAGAQRQTGLIPYEARSIAASLLNEP